MTIERNSPRETLRPERRKMCSKKYAYQVPSFGLQDENNMYITGNNEPISMTHRNHARVVTSPTFSKRPLIPSYTVFLIFTVLLCVFSCLLTATVSYKWYLDNNREVERLVTTIEEVIHDLNTYTSIVRAELVAKRVNNAHKQHQNNNSEDGDKKDNKKEENDYEDVFDDYETDKFMGKDLVDNNWPTKNYSPDEFPQNPKDRQRRNAVIDGTASLVKNEMNNSIKHEKSNVDINQDGSIEENVYKSYNNRYKQKKLLDFSKKKSDLERKNEDSNEDFKETQEAVAAHFISDPSKYSTKTHLHYKGNGRLNHPDGDYKDWTQHLWDINLNNGNHFQMKNGKIEVLKPGVYFVYSQIYYSDTHDINGYYVMKNDEKVLGCTTTRHRETQSDSCYTGGLIYLNSRDILSVKGLDSERFIILDPVKSFFGLFKVSKESKR